MAFSTTLFFQFRKGFSFFGILMVAFSLAVGADTFIGALPTGLVELSDYKYPVYLYVPQNYKPDRQYALVISLPGDGESPENHMKAWSDLAKRRSFLVLVPTLQPREEDVPYSVDQWLFRLKKDIENRYRIHPQKIYLVGTDATAHYASYLGTQYAEEFSAAALLGRAWAGPFEKLIHLEKRPVLQVPFFVAVVESDGETTQKTESWSLDLVKKGYPVYLEKVKDREALHSKVLKQKAFAWLEENSVHWQKTVETSQRKWNEKFLGKLKDFVKVE